MSELRLAKRTSRPDRADSATILAMEDKLCSFSEARKLLAEHLKIHIRDSDISQLVDLKIVVNFADASNGVKLLADEVTSYGAKIDWEPASATRQPEDTLFKFDPPRADPQGSDRVTGGQLVFTIRDDFSVKFAADTFRPYEYQLFRREFRRIQNDPFRSAYPLKSHMLGGPTFVSPSVSLRELAISAWRRVAENNADATDDERRITPSIYGVKTRLLPMIASVIGSLAQPGSVVCDLMSGSGIVTRSLSKTHSLFSNDANSYGRVLALSLTAELDKGEVTALVARLKSRMLYNMAGIEKLYSRSLVEEHELLHSARTPATLDRYRSFCDRTPRFSGSLADEGGDLSPNRAELESVIGIRRGRPRTFPFILATAYWANVHFGLRQCVLLDSIRYAIEYEKDAFKTLLLGILLQAALLCASGPHFAQPFKPKGPRQFKSLIEKRARRIDAEFYSLLTRRSIVPASPQPVIEATKLNWREALQTFASILEGRRGVVYADPPYTSVQYSRYYHVLNVLVDYDYPVCSGPGICPVREYRFSSRFEFKAGPARAELRELIRQCARSDFDLALSYSKSGAVTIADLIAEFQACYKQVEIFQAGIKHHPQGKATLPGRLNTVEYLIVGQKPLLSAAPA
jgi:hypothetical protein